MKPFFTLIATIYFFQVYASCIEEVDYLVRKYRGAEALYLLDSCQASKQKDTEQQKELALLRLWASYEIKDLQGMLAYAKQISGIYADDSFF